MRVDRLVAILILLQRRGQVTAGEVAEELEVSERTARRDLEALVVAGVPIYSMRGRGGGWRLVGGARTDLSGLTAGEARALFMVAGQGSAGSPEARAALRKLVHALPEPFRAQAEAAGASFVVDPQRWGSAVVEDQPPVFLDDLQEAVIRGVQVRLGYTDREGAVSRRIVHPLGVVVKGPTWYLVAGTERGERTFRIDRVTAVEPTEDPVERPAGFDLAQRWRAIAAEVEVRRSPMAVQALCAPHGLGLLRMVTGDRLEVGDTAADGRVEVTVWGYSAYALAGELAGLVEWVEVTGPAEVRDQLAAIGQDLVAQYGSGA